MQELRLLSLNKNYIPAAEATAHDHAEPQTQENGGDQDDGCHELLFHEKFLNVNPRAIQES